MDIRRVMCAIMEDMVITMEKELLNLDMDTAAMGMDMVIKVMVTTMEKDLQNLDIDIVAIRGVDMVMEDMAITMARDLQSPDAMVTEVTNMAMDTVMDMGIVDKQQRKLLEFSIVEVST